LRLVTRDRTFTYRSALLPHEVRRAWRNSTSASPLEPSSTSGGATVGSGTIKSTLPSKRMSGQAGIDTGTSLK
jgi:hypothetical protein